MDGNHKEIRGRVPVKEGLFPWPLPGGEAAQLVGSRCERCGKSFFPKRTLCPYCQRTQEMKEISLSRRGRLYTYTIVRQAPKGFTPPYATALVDLPEGVRLFCQLTTADPEVIQIGGVVVLTFGPITVDSEGNEVISYLFRPAGEI